MRSEFEVTYVNSKPHADAAADRHDNNVVGAQRGEAEAADEIGGSVEAAEALVDRSDRGQILD